MRGAPVPVGSLRRSVRLATAAAALALLSCGGGGGGSSGGYHIQLQYETTITDTQRAAFESAAARIGQVVVGSQSVVSFGHGETCDSEWGGAKYPVPDTVGNLLIFVEVKPIDGPLKVVASSGPCYTRTSNDIPVVGIMTFDSADLPTIEANGTLKSVILHEMLHVVGFGTVWTDKGLLSGATGSDPEFTGSAAISAFHGSNGGTTATVPVEAGGGAGTALSHWRESVFKNELMTGYISGATQPLSATTIGSLADLGYHVNLAQADPYNLATASNVRALVSGATEEPAVFVGDDTRAARPIPVDDTVPAAP
jgi:hypothetical protein